MDQNSVDQEEAQQRIIFFDGYCSLCNHSINICMRNNQRGLFKVASLQGNHAKRLLGENYSAQLEPDSIILYDAGVVYSESSAVLRIAKMMDFPYPLATVFLVVPPFIRNMVYRWIARNRYKWFGKRDSCRLPTPEEAGMMLD